MPAQVVCVCVCVCCRRRPGTYKSVHYHVAMNVVEVDVSTEACWSGYFLPTAFSVPRGASIFVARFHIQSGRFAEVEL
ncbi:hypothetical protein Pfo_025730 [Paulownia fortunei]|nr:hypothetical protein Pfo_025730 [Paulownia fortunei]